MKRREFLKGAGASGLAGALAAQASPPNVMLVVATSRASAEEPAIRNGVRFDRAYAATPSGQSLPAILAGRFPHALTGREPTILDVLRDHRYAIVHSFDEWSANQRLPSFFYQRQAEPRLTWDDPGGDALIVIVTLYGQSRGEPLDRSARVLLEMAYGNRLRGDSSGFLVSHVDIMPTILGFCGVPIPGGVQGRDLAPLLLRGIGDVPDSVYSYGKLGTRNAWRMIVRGWDKLVINLEDEPTAHYNLRNDPEEEANLVKRESTEARRTRDSLLAQLIDWRRRLGDGYDASGLRTRSAEIE